MDSNKAKRIMFYVDIEMNDPQKKYICKVIKNTNDSLIDFKIFENFSYYSDKISDFANSHGLYINEIDNHEYIIDDKELNENTKNINDFWKDMNNINSKNVFNYYDNNI